MINYINNVLLNNINNDIKFSVNNIKLDNINTFNQKRSYSTVSKPNNYVTNRRVSVTNTEDKPVDSFKKNFKDTLL